MNCDHPTDEIGFDTKIIQAEIASLFSGESQRSQASYVNNHPPSSPTIAQRIKQKMSDAEQVNRMSNRETNKRAPYVGNIRAPSCVKGNEGFEVHENTTMKLDSAVIKFLLILLVVLCIVQYISYQIISSRLSDLMLFMTASSYGRVNGNG